MSNPTTTTAATTTVATGELTKCLVGIVVLACAGVRTVVDRLVRELRRDDGVAVFGAADEQAFGQLEALATEMAGKRLPYRLLLPVPKGGKAEVADGTATVTVPSRRPGEFTAPFITEVGRDKRPLTRLFTPSYWAVTVKVAGEYEDRILRPAKGVEVTRSVPVGTFSCQRMELRAAQGAAVEWTPKGAPVECETAEACVRTTHIARQYLERVLVDLDRERCRVERTRGASNQLGATLDAVRRQANR